MAFYKPTFENMIPMILYPVTWESEKGVRKKVVSGNGNLFYGTFKTFGGTEKNVNGVVSIEDTAMVETWYREDISSDCQIEVCQTGKRYEVLNEPENISMRNLYSRFKVRRIKGAV